MARTEQLRWKVSAGGETTEAAFDPATGSPRGVMVLAHGAGGNMEARNVLREARVLRDLGFGVVRFNFFYRAARRSYPDKMPQLILCYSAVIESFAEHLRGVASKNESGKLLLGGHSMGGRVATMMAADGFPSDGLILFSYPLHPPGKFDQLRAVHLPRIKVPVLCFNGTRDDFMRRDLMEDLLPTLRENTDRAGWTHHWIEHADHSLAVRKKDGRTSAEVESEIAQGIGEWLKVL